MPYGNAPQTSRCRGGFTKGDSMNIIHLLKAHLEINPLKAFKTLYAMILFRLTWKRHDSDYCPPGLPPKFLSARQAMALIPDQATIIIGGFASTARSSIFYWTLREAFENTGHPCDLTVIGSDPQGGRGMVPGTIEELGIPGIITRYIVGHGETAKALLQLADDGHLELHTMPQGELAFLIEGQGRGQSALETPIGVGTFLDPRVGDGSAVSKGAKTNFIQVKDDNLVYTLPKIDHALFLAPYADMEGNIYFKDAALILENREATLAAKFNRGKVIVSVAAIIPKNADEISIPADMVDAIVVNPRNEQIGGVLQTMCWPFFAGPGHMDTDEAAKLLKLVNTFMGITPYRGHVAEAMARMAARLFVQETRPGATINIGIGLGEEVARILHASGLSQDITFTTEGGALGGLPASGIYFGSAINPEQILSTAEMFHLYHARLDTAVLGFLQVDSAGNVNVSHRGPRMLDFVGPGGFTDIVACSKTIIFVGNWMDKACFIIEKGRLILKKTGKPKFVAQVDHITFNGQEALKAGKRVFYVTTVGIFKLTEDGLTIIQCMPGIDIGKDILAASPARFIIPDRDVPTVPPEIVNGKGFHLRWAGESAA